MVHPNDEFIALAKHHGFNPVFLREILWYRNQGCSNVEIAGRTGISRNTVNAYVDRLGNIENDEAIAKLVLFAVALVAGGTILAMLVGANK